MKSTQKLSRIPCIIAVMIAIIGFSLVSCSAPTTGENGNTQVDILTGTVTINNTSPKVGDTIVAAYSGGNGTGAASWQWLRNGTVIPGETHNNYEVTDTDLGTTLKARVSYENQSGSVTSNATAVVTASNLPTLTGTVTINNTAPKVGDTLIAAYSGGNGTGIATWQWLRNDTIISGATHHNYEVTDTDLNATLKARVNYVNQSGSITSNATSAVTASNLPTLTGTVTIDNTTPKVGDTLTANYSGNGSGAAIWQWLRNDEIIDNANGNTYDVVSADLNAALKARVNYANQSGSITSNATAAVNQTDTGLIDSIYYWVNENDVLAATNGGAVTVSKGEVLTITAQEEGYTIIQWKLNGVDTGLTTASYDFSGWAAAKHNVTLIVEKGGRYYSAEFAITVE